MSRPEIAGIGIDILEYFCPAGVGERVPSGHPFRNGNGALLTYAWVFGRSGSPSFAPEARPRPATAECRHVGARQIGLQGDVRPFACSPPIWFMSTPSPCSGSTRYSSWRYALRVPINHPVPLEKSVAQAVTVTGRPLRP